jgi:hypothetical protein
MQLSDWKKLVGAESTPVWMDTKNGHCLYPWEAAALAVIFSHASRQCVATLVPFGAALAVPPVLRAAKVVVDFEERLSRYAPMRPPNYRFTWGYNCLNRIVPLSEPNYPDSDYFQAPRVYYPVPQQLRYPAWCPPRAAPSVAVLPSMAVLESEPRGFLLAAATEDQFDLFSIAANALDYTDLLDLYHEEIEGLLYAMAHAPDPFRYFQVMPLTFFTQLASPQGFVIATASTPALFSAALSTLAAALRQSVMKIVFTRVVEPATSFGGTILPVLASDPEIMQVIMGFYNPTPADTQQILLPPLTVLRAALSVSPDSGKVVWEALKAKGIPVTRPDLQRYSAFLLESVLKLYGRKQLQGLKFLVDELIPLGLDMTSALKGQPKLGRINVPIQIVGEVLRKESHRKLLRRMITERQLFNFGDPRAIDYCIDVLKWVPPIADSSFWAEVLYRPFGILVAASLFLRYRPQLSPNQKVLWIQLLCQETRQFEPDSREAAASVLIEFARQGWLDGFPFADKDGFQHRLQLGPTGTMDLHPNPIPCGICQPLVDLLRNHLRADFSQVNASGEFPLSIALQNHAWQDVQYLLHERLFPKAEILMRYRHRRTGDTLLSLLFQCRGWIPPGVPIASDIYHPHLALVDPIDICPDVDPSAFIDLCEGLGIDVIKQLATIEVSGRLPLYFASHCWPLRAIKYLVNDLKIHGSVPPSSKRFEAMLKAIGASGAHHRLQKMGCFEDQ